MRAHHIPWTKAGRPDPDYTPDERAANADLLTDRGLTARFRRVLPGEPPDYDAMIRALGAVWDCHEDRTAVVTGYCCPVCGVGRDGRSGSRF